MPRCFITLRKIVFKNIKFPLILGLYISYKFIYFLFVVNIKV